MARAHAESAVERSRTFLFAAGMLARRSLVGRVESRSHRCHAQVEGVVDGSAVKAVVRKNGEVVGDRPLPERAKFVAALADSFHEGLAV